MNVLHLFGNKNIEDKKLGIQVVKSLGYQKEFERHFKITLDVYETVLNNIISYENFDYSDRITWGLLENNLDTSSFIAIDVYWVLQKYPELINLFETLNFPKEYFSALLSEQPQLIEKCNLSVLDDDEISYILKHQPQLKTYFDK